MSLATRSALSLLLLLLAAPAVRADDHGDGSDTASHPWTNPGKVVPCEFPPGPVTVTGLILAKGCDPAHDAECNLSLHVLSIKDDSVRSWLAHDPAGRCTIELDDGRKRTLGQAWAKSEHGEKVMRVTGVVTDGVLSVSRTRVLGDAEGMR